MKSFLEYQSQYWRNHTIITESFQSSILRDIKNQIDDMNDKHHENEAESRYSYSWRYTNYTFKYVFSNKGINWNSIKDEDFKECRKDDDASLKLAKRITSNRSNSFPGIIILLNDAEEPKYTGIIFGDSNSNTYMSLLISNYSFRTSNFKPGEIEDMLTNRFLLLDISNKTTHDIYRKRSAEKFGSLNPTGRKELRDDIYKKIAEQNRERYKKYVAKVKAEKDANDGMGEKVNEYVQKIMDVTIKMSKNPTKYIKYEYDVCYLIDLLSDKRIYVNDTKYKGHYSGKDGLLILYKRYIKNKLAQSKGNAYDHETREYNTAKNDLELMFKTIDERLEKFADVE